MATITLDGTVRGQTIELDAPQQVPDDERVRVQVSFSHRERRVRLLGSFGRWNKDEALDAALAQVDEERRARPIA